MMSTAAPSDRLPLLDLPLGEHTRGVGILEVTRDCQKVKLPLSDVDIKARVADRIASVTITESFRNEYTDHLEAVYIFPLSPGCAVSDFEMRVGQRVIKGKIEERGEARRQYQQALDDGKRAALLEQERDDVFTVQVGNLPPGEEVTVSLTYSERLPFFEDGKTEIRLPLVVAPRYIPGAALERDQAGDGTELDTDAVPDASRITPPRLVPGFDPEVALKISVELIQAESANGSGISDFLCSQHATKTGLSSGALKVELARTDERLDRDFVLRWRLAGKSVKSSVISYRDSDGAHYAMLSILPPKREGYLGAPRDVVFVLDRSGSMQGIKMTSAARACSILLSTLGPQDRFAIQIFDNVTEWLAPGKKDRFQKADEAGIERGIKFLRGVEARGGTEMDNALADALNAVNSRKDKDGRVPVLVILTDGEVGDESRILKRIQTDLGDCRLFAVGIDTAVNDGLLRRVANLGGGTATFVEPGTQLEDALLQVGRDIGRPLVLDLQIDALDAAIDKTAIAPNRVPDLFAGRAVTVFLKLSKPGRIRLKGRFTDGSKFSEEVRTSAVDLPSIAQLWAKTHITDLEDAFRIHPDQQKELKKKIIEIAVKHTVLTRFTAFVVVDESEVVNADGTIRKIVQPVESPASWDMPAETYGAQGGQMWGALPTVQAAQLSMPSARSFVPPCGAPAPDAKHDDGWGQARQWGEAAAGWAQSFLVSQGPGSGAKQPPPPPSTGERSASAGRERQRRESSDNRSVGKALDDFAAALRQAFAQIKLGRLQAPEPLEKARKDLLKVLSASPTGSQVPLLQKFLRGAAVELTASIKASDCDVAALIPLWEKHLREFQEAKAEAAAVISGSRAAEESAPDFWESTI